ncbi:threonine ammonia-lyase [Membranicola marinus]|uniref:L-threonine dehydratase n=1 Tax=Membranihabitans marinus TaxID=1227546 RepID=A0A953L8I0_9BACT|nr:threonine ammonia-lyase [Membranihabitans marinus]MBY5959847.1 threonine ammonia-lyase [Membranihabitans marinus]
MSKAILADSSLLNMEMIEQAAENLSAVVQYTPLVRSEVLSERYECNVWLKREDMQKVRSYKIRGAYNKMASVDPDALQNGIVCASAGNHAQGVALSCRMLNVPGTIYMPNTTPNQKVKKVEFFGRSLVTIHLVGDTFDDSYRLAMEDAKTNHKVFIHPFDDPHIIAGQGTVGLEILEKSQSFDIDYLFLPIGGGGLASGVGTVFKKHSPSTRIIGLEPEGAPAMYESLRQNHLVTLENIDPFIDGAAVRRAGERTFEICKEVIDDITLIPEGKVCTTILQMYNEEAIVVEPAGAMSISALDFYKYQIKGKNVVCVISGGNNDITRTEEIKEKSLIYEGLKHYFIINFPQRAGALRDFLNNVLGPRDDIAFFEYVKKTSRESGPAIVGIELNEVNDYQGLIDRMKKYDISFHNLNDDSTLFELLIG